MPGPRAQMVRFFLFFTYIWQKNVVKITKVPGAQRDIIWQRITWFVDETLYCIIFNNNSPPSCQILRTKYFKKN